MQSSYKSKQWFFILAFICAIFVLGSQTAEGASKGGARVIVQRTPNLGTNVVVELSIDGRRVAGIPRNQHYEGRISGGRHVLSVLAMPNTQVRRPTSMRVTLQSGRTYIFTAMWEQDHLVLRRSTSYSPTRALSGM